MGLLNVNTMKWIGLVSLVVSGASVYRTVDTVTAMIESPIHLERTETATETVEPAALTRLADASEPAAQLVVAR